MSALAALLLALGTADALRARSRGGDRRSEAVAVAAGAGLLLALAFLADLRSTADLLLLAASAVLLALWVTTSGEDRVRTRGARTPLVILASGAVAVIACSGWSSPAGGPIARWLVWADLGRLSEVSAERALLLAGLLLVQLATGNVLVRLVLIQVGAIKPRGTPQASDRLRGGRLLGPMERVLILGLGLAGEVGAAALVIAAKGLIRWPELQHSRDGEPGTPALIRPPRPGVDEVTEYFLLGSMVSWLVALAALALAALS